MEAQVIITMLYLYYDIALKVAQNLTSATRDLLRYLGLLVNSDYWMDVDLTFSEHIVLAAGGRIQNTGK